MSKLKQVDSNLNLVSLEQQILDYWDKAKIFEKVNKKGDGKEEWVYYDGPITANNLPHYGHVITWTMKDVLPRYWTMNGMFVSRNIGWDCQGIPVEYEVEKRLEFKNKDDIEKFGVAKFNELCRQSVLEYRDSMFSYERRVGRWMDLNDQYSTMDKNYIESIWWSLKELYTKGLLYEGYKVVAYSTRAGTTLSNAEVALGGYKEIVDPAVTIKFKKADEENTYFLAWTTTPWTLPGNLLLAVGKEIDYVKIEHNNEYYILAKDCLSNVFDTEVKVVKEIKSEDLVNAKYIPLFDFFKNKEAEGAFKVVYADHVTTEDGTGIVHLAPYGMEDFDILTDLGISIFDYLDDTAHFNSIVPAYTGQFYKQASKQIIEDLTKENLLLKVQDYPHQMPMCWRTDTPLIYKPVKSWYLAVTKIKDKLININNDIKWTPSHVKKGRFGRWLENARDWALSRNRYWGTPLPVWVNDKTGETVVIGSFAELQMISGTTLNKNFDPHRPFVDEITWQGANGGTFKRINDVLDVWYDSGSMPFAQYHYPFENKEKFENKFPAEYISESVDQTRGWFYSLLVINVALFDKSPYKSVVMSGMLLGEDGNKLSKSKKNYPPMDEVLNNFGSEILRFFLLSSPVVRGESARFSNHFLNEVKKEFFTTLWNSYRYFITYASGFDFENTVIESNSDSILDQWINTRLKKCIYEVNNYMQKNEVMYAVRLLPEFVNDLSTWYIRRSRDRISSGDRKALETLYTNLRDLCKLMSPFLPLVSESLYQNFRNIDANLLESVHLEEYPKFKELNAEEENLLVNMDAIRQLASLGNAARKEVNIPVRQALSELVIKNDRLKIEDSLLDILKDELNVKEVSFAKELPNNENWKLTEDKNFKIALNTEITSELKLEGAYRNLVREIQSLRKEKGLQVGDKIALTLLDSKENREIFSKFGAEFKEKVGVSKIIWGEHTSVEVV